MSPFLRDFYPLAILYKPTLENVYQEAVQKARELLLLGYVDVAAEIIELCDDGLTGWMKEEQAMLLRVAVDAARREGVQFSEVVERLERKLPRVTDEEFEEWAKGKWAHLPETWGYNEASYDEIMGIVEELTDSPAADATTGFAAMRVSAALTACCVIAYKLAWADKVEVLTKRMVKRVHANQQANYMLWVRQAWGMYVQGAVLDLLELEEREFRGYAEMVRDTVRERLVKGARSHEAWAGERSLMELLTEVEVNTKEYRALYVDEEEDNEDDKDIKKEMRILHEAATEDELAEAERRLETTLPKDLHDLYKICNGTDPTLQGEGYNAWPVQILGPLDDFKIQRPEENPQECTPMLIPLSGCPPLLTVDLFGRETDCDIAWPTIKQFIAVNGCSRDDNDGCCLLLRREDAIQAKKAVEAWLAADSRTCEERDVIERRIKDYYGSRERFEKIGNGNGEWQGFMNYTWDYTTLFFPDSRSLVCWLAFESSLAKELDPSPMPAPKDDQ